MGIVINIDELHQDDPPSDELEICCIKASYLNNISVMMTSPAIFLHLLHENHKRWKSSSASEHFQTPTVEYPSQTQKESKSSPALHRQDSSIFQSVIAPPSISLFRIFSFFPAFLFKCRAALTTTFMVLSGVPGLFQNVFFPFYLYVCVCVCVCERVSAFINDSARLFQTDATAIRWWKWFMETGQQITVTSQIHRSSCYYSHPLSLHSV